MSDRIYCRKLPIITLVVPVWREIRDPISCIVKKPSHSGFSNNLLFLPLSHSCRFFTASEDYTAGLSSVLGSQWPQLLEPCARICLYYQLGPLYVNTCANRCGYLWMWPRLCCRLAYWAKKGAASIFKNTIFKLNPRAFVQKMHCYALLGNLCW